MENRLKDPTITARIHLTLTALWVILIVPTILWWQDSIMWVLIISIYANIVGHISAWQATQAEKNSNS